MRGSQGGDANARYSLLIGLISPSQPATFTGAGIGGIKLIIMGLYINKNSKEEALPNFGKVEALLADGATLTDGEKFEPNLICVADRVSHDAAIYCYDEREFQYVSAANKRNEDDVTWLIHPKAKELAK